MDHLTLSITGISNSVTAANDDSARRRVLKIWSEKMRAFWDRRFVQASRGDGTWAPLKAATEKRRRKGKKVNRHNAEQVSIQEHFKKARILIDTGLLRGALNPKQISPGTLENVSVAGASAVLTLGFGGSAIHPKRLKKKKKGKKRPSQKASTKPPLTIAKLAAIHHFGNLQRGLPARPLLVEPDERTLKQLETIAIQELMRNQ